MMIFGGSTAADSSHTLMPASITSLRANLTRRSSRFEGQSRRVILPQTTPFIFTVAHTGLSLTWRLMIFVELLSRSSGVGYRIPYFYNLADMKRVMAAALRDDAHCAATPPDSTNRSSPVTR